MTKRLFPSTTDGCTIFVGTFESPGGNALKPARVIELRAGAAADFATLVEIDDDAADLFVRAGLDVDLPPTHEFTVKERARWRDCLDTGTVAVAMNQLLEPIGFAAVSMRGGDPFLQQISVRRSAMRRGVGSTLLQWSLEHARNMGAPALWLTTYAHLPWNRPFYEKWGFRLVPDEDCPAGLLEELAFERRWLPQPHERVVMRAHT